MTMYTWIPQAVGSSYGRIMLGDSVIANDVDVAHAEPLITLANAALRTGVSARHQCGCKCKAGYVCTSCRDIEEVDAGYIVQEQRRSKKQ